MEQFLGVFFEKCARFCYEFGFLKQRISALDGRDNIYVKKIE